MKVIKSFAGTIIVVILLIIGSCYMNNTEREINNSNIKYVVDKKIDYSSNVCKLKISNGDKSIWINVTADKYDENKIGEIYNN